MEIEPNDTTEEANTNGRLVSGNPYLGLPNNGSEETGFRDYFMLQLDTPGFIVIDVVNHPLANVLGVKLQLFYKTSDNQVANLDTPPYHIEYNGKPGIYFILILNDIEKCSLVGIGCSAYYTLTAKFP